MTESQFANSVGAQWDNYLKDLQSGRSRFLPLPWPAMEQIIRVGYRRKIGLVAQRGTSEATAGRQIAAHIADHVGHVLLCTAYPPEKRERLHVLDELKLTPEMVNNRVRRLIGAGTAPALIVVERYERMRLDDADDDVSRGDELMWCGRRVEGQYDDLNIPTIFTTVVDREPVMDRWVRDWAGVDAPANVMTDFCRSVLLLRRVDGQQVRVRVELDSDEYQHPRVTDVDWPTA
jgi:hypothetical protein